MGECQWENCEETVIDDEKAEVCGRKWGQLKNSMDVTMGDRMNVNNEMRELVLCKYTKLVFCGKKYLRSDKEILYTAFT